MVKPDTAAWWRGGSTGLLTVALAVGAHALAGGGAPAGAALALLIVLAGTVGTVTTHADRARGVGGLTAVLAIGQLLGHVVLAAAGHSHGAQGVPTPTMLAAHAAAVVIGAAVIAAGARLCKTLSTAVRQVSTPLPASPTSAVVITMTSDQPLQWTLSLRACLPHRGPPVGSVS